MPWEFALQEIFLRFFHFTRTAGWVILAVLLLRAILYRLPRKHVCLLWLAVLFRLLCPITIETEFAVVPQTTKITYSDIAYTTPKLETSSAILSTVAENTINPILEESLAPVAQASVNPMQILLFAASIIWICGIALFALYTIISWFKMLFKLRESIPEAGYYQCANIASPFVFGFLKPKIYLPYGLDDTAKEYILLHERSHIRRGDFIVKPLFWIAVVIHWTNPLVWIAWHYFCKDLELACDECAVDSLTSAQKSAYSDTLLHLAVEPKKFSCPVAFGNNSVRQRIVHVLQYKRISPLARNFVLVLLTLVVVLLLMNPAKEESQEITNNAIILQKISASWAETYANRDGQGRYDLLTSNWKNQIDLLDEYENFGELWIPYWTEDKQSLDLRGSSPWVKDWNIRNQAEKNQAYITYEMTDSSGAEYIYEENIVLAQEATAWKVADCSVSVQLLPKEVYLCAENIYLSLKNDLELWRLDPISVASKFIEDYLQLTEEYLLEWNAEDNIVQCHTKEQDYVIYLYQPIQQSEETSFYAVSAYEYEEISEDGKKLMYYYVADDMWASLHIEEQTK